MSFYCLPFIFTCRLVLYLYACAVENPEISGFCVSKSRGLRFMDAILIFHPFFGKRSNYFQSKLLEIQHYFKRLLNDETERFLPSQSLKYRTRVGEFQFLISSVRILRWAGLLAYLSVSKMNYISEIKPVCLDGDTESSSQLRIKTLNYTFFTELV